MALTASGEAATDGRRSRRRDRCRQSDRARRRCRRHTCSPCPRAAPGSISRQKSNASRLFAASCASGLSKSSVWFGWTSTGSCAAAEPASSASAMSNSSRRMRRAFSRVPGTIALDLISAGRRAGAVSLRSAASSVGGTPCEPSSSRCSLRSRRSGWPRPSRRITRSPRSTIRTNPITLTGKVSKVEWTNPHARFYLDVKDPTRPGRDLELRACEPELLETRGLVQHVAEGRRSDHGRRFDRTQRREHGERPERDARGRLARVRTQHRRSRTDHALRHVRSRGRARRRRLRGCGRRAAGAEGQHVAGR